MNAPIVMAGLDPAIEHELRQRLSVMAGLDPAIRGETAIRSSGEQVFIEVPPLGVLTRDQVNLPRARPVLDVRLALDRNADIIVPFRIYHHPEPITFGEPVTGTGSMLPGAPSEIVGDAGVKEAEWPIGDDINPAAAHPTIQQPKGLRSSEFGGPTATTDGRVRPGHDGGRRP